MQSTSNHSIFCLFQVTTVATAVVMLMMGSLSVLTMGTVTVADGDRDEFPGGRQGGGTYVYPEVISTLRPQA